MAKITFDTTQIKRVIEDNPLVAAAAAAALLNGAAKLMNANTQRVNSKTWKTEVARRDRTK